MISNVQIRWSDQVNFFSPITDLSIGDQLIDYLFLMTSKMSDSSIHSIVLFWHVIVWDIDRGSWWIQLKIYLWCTSYIVLFYLDRFAIVWDVTSDCPIQLSTTKNGSDSTHCPSILFFVPIRWRLSWGFHGGSQIVNSFRNHLLRIRALLNPV